MRKILWIVAIVIIIVAGYSAWQNYLGENNYSNKEVVDNNTKVDTKPNDNITENMVGSWQSTYDAKSVKVFKSDGVTEDVYDREVVSSGTWEIVNGTILKTLTNDEEYLYTIVLVNESDLELTYLARGNTLKYKKIAQ